MDVELLVTPDCPHEGATAVVLRRALDDVGLMRIPIRTRVVSTSEEADRLRFTGSPTVLIDGDDPFLKKDARVTLGCRVYPSGGLMSPVPDIRTLRQALKRHAAS